MEDVIISATLHGAKALGLEHEIGTVTPGKLANMVFLREDPLSGMAAMKSIDFTLRRGVRFDRSDFELGEAPGR